LIFHLNLINILLVWHGVIFIREGPYKDGIFKFEIRIPSSYPKSAPEVYFTTYVGHPLIDPYKGKLDLNVGYNNLINEHNFYSIHKYFIRKNLMFGNQEGIS